MEVSDRFIRKRMLIKGHGCNTNTGVYASLNVCTCREFISQQKFIGFYTINVHCELDNWFNESRWACIVVLSSLLLTEWIWLCILKVCKGSVSIEKYKTVGFSSSVSGCQSYEAPNATHIAVLRTAVEGQSFMLYCDFNGDVSHLHYIPEWDKGSWRDVVLHGGGNKYKSYRKTNCPSGSPCCSFTDLLVVSNATQNDTDLYTCVAWPVDSGAPLGSNLSVYIGR